MWLQWIRTLTGLVIIVGFLEMLLPDNDLKKFAKLVLGLVLMLAILQPLLALLQWNWHPQLEIPTTGPSVSGDWAAQAEQIQSVGLKPVLSTVEHSVTRQVEALVLTIDGIEQVRSRINSTSDGRVGRVELWITLDNQIRTIKPIEIEEQERNRLSMSEDLQIRKADQVRRVVAHYLDVPIDMVEINLVNR